MRLPWDPSDSVADYFRREVGGGNKFGCSCRELVRQTATTSDANVAGGLEGG